MFKKVMLKKIIFQTFLFISLILLSSCEKENMFDLFKSTGDIVTEKRELNNFSGIDLFDKINLFLVQDTINYLTIEAGENLMKSIDTKVENGILKLENNNRCNFVRSYNKKINITVHYFNLRNINYFGAGTIKTVNQMESTFFELAQYDGSGNSEFLLQVDTVRWISHTGPGNCVFNGNCKNAYFYASGQSILHAENLIGLNTSVNSAGSGDFYIHAENSINAEIYSIGNVYYNGNPFSTNRSGKGRGELIKID
jgi:hypothetical protein